MVWFNQVCSPEASGLTALLPFLDVCLLGVLADQLANALGVLPLHLGPVPHELGVDVGQVLPAAANLHRALQVCPAGPTGATQTVCGFANN